jgi:hypothetical protein
MKTKILGILVCMLLIGTILSVSGAEITTVSYEDTDPDLNCLGEIIWNDVVPGSIVKNIFYVENIGGPISELDWEITDWPEWGTWYFLPPEGDNLKPNDGACTVYVFVEVDDPPYRHYSGNVTVVNKDNNSDFEILPVTLSTPVNQNLIYPQLIQFIQRMTERFPNAFPILRTYLGY